MSRLLFLTFFCLVATMLTAQFTFKKRFGTTGVDRAFAVEVLPDNSFIVAGATTGGGLGNDDALLVKFTPDGSVEWSKVLGGSNMDRFGVIFSSGDGNFIAMGETNSLGAGNFDIYIVKFDNNGNVLWERTSGGSALETYSGICEVADGYVITGTTQSFGNGNSDILVEKMDFGGTSLWCKAWGGNNSDFSGYPLAAPNGDIWVSGSVDAGTADGILMRINGNGTLLNARRISGPVNDNINYLKPGGPGMVGSGASNSYSTGAVTEPWMNGFNAAGGLVWSKRYLMPSGSHRIYAQNCMDGGFVFAPFSFFANMADAYLVKTDNMGNVSWAKSYSFNGLGKVYQVCQAPDGGYVMVGSFSSPAFDIFILKTDAEGNVDGCCPVNAVVTAEVVSPTNPITPYTGIVGPGAQSPSGGNEPVTLTETNICSGSSCCSTDAGTMFVQTLNRCINLPATFTHNGDEVLDADDLLQFILFSNLNDTLGSIIATSNTPTFSYNPATMQTDVTYYIAAIAGNNLNGNVDLNDPCLDISNAAFLIWRPLPTVTFTVANPDICAGACTTVTAVFTGTAPFTLTYTTPGGAAMLQSFSGNTGTFQVCTLPGSPPGSWTMQAIKVMDAWCSCE